MKFLTKEGVFAGGEEYTLVGRPVNGEAYEVDDEIVVVGEDTAVVLPQYGVIGVFDGAGGTKDMGSPLEAALTAADTVRHEYQVYDGDVSGADVMRRAGKAVAQNPEASLCMGALLRIRNGLLEVANVGDTGIWTYDTTNNEEKMIAEQQLSRMDGGDPANYMGKPTRRIPPRSMADFHAIIPYAPKKEVYIGTDGILGNWVYGNELLYTGQLEVTHDNDFPLFDNLRRNDENFVANIRRLLGSELGGRLRQEQLAGHDEIISPELDNPDLFTGERFDWEIWSNIVQPYARTLDLPPRQKLSQCAILTSLINPGIRWPFEDWKDNDDATVAMIVRQ